MRYPIFQPHSGSLGSSSLRGPACGSLVTATLSPVLHHSYSESTRLGLSHRQTPQTRLARPKLPQPLVQLVDVAPFIYQLLLSSSAAGHVGGVCTAVGEFPALQV